MQNCQRIVGMLSEVTAAVSNTSFLRSCGSEGISEMSRYIDQNLQLGEVVAYRGRPSKTALFIRPLLFIVGFIVADSIARAQGTAASTTDSSSKTALQAFFALIAVFLIVMAIANLVGALVFLRSAEYAVTDRRVVAKYGLFRRHSVDMILPGIASVVAKQSAFGRVCGYGNVFVRAAGGDRSITYIKDPKRFTSAVLTELSSARLLKGTAAYELGVKPASSAHRSGNGESGSVLSTAPPLPPGTQAHWATDPHDQHSMRYWDGNRWTDHVAPTP